MTPRIIVADHEGALLFELAPDEVTSLVMTEEVNGEHSLEIGTTAALEKEHRILLRDGTGKWREFVVMRAREERLGGTYWCPWSLQHDLAVNAVSAMPGTGTAGGVAAAVALAAALQGSGWGVGTVTQSSSAAASMYQMSSYQALGVLTETWGGEVDARITVDDRVGVTGRAVCLYSEQGQQVATRRFDYGHDMPGIRRLVDEKPIACRIIPRGKGEQTAEGGYGRKVTIEDVNGGVPYLRDTEMEGRLRLADGAGGWAYPTVYADNGDIEDPQELKAWGLSVLHDYTRPKVTYDADVVQLAQAGMDPTGIALGDAVQCVDAGFPGGGLRIEGRVVKLVENLLDASDVRVTVGYLDGGIAGALKGAASGVKALQEGLESLGNTTAEYLSHLLDHLNEEMNAAGGWSYIVPGRGMITYSAEVSDPETGAEVKAIINGGGEGSVVEVSGGGIRLADSLKPNGEWDFKTLIQSGHILAELVTAARLVTGFIASANAINPDGTFNGNGNYWDLDTGELHMTAIGAKVGGDTLADYVGGVAESSASGAISTYDNAMTQQEILRRLTGGYVTEGLYIQNGHLYINASALKTGSLLASLITTGKIQSNNGRVYFDLDNNELACDRMVDTTYGTYVADIGQPYSNAYGTYGFKVYNSSSADDAVVLVPGVSGNNLSMPTVTGSGRRLRVACKTRQGGGSRTVGYAGMMITNDGYTVLYGQQNSQMTEATAKADSTQHNGRIVIRPQYTGSGSTYDSDGGVYVYGALDATVGTAKFSTIQASNLKSRIVATEDYGDRLLYCYETPAPLFGDVGSGRIGDDGTCVIEIDAVFAETARSDMAYQVFLQKCGQGDLWVAGKAATHFTVEGTPGLAFDWELKAHQAGFEFQRIEQGGWEVDERAREASMRSPEDAYADYVTEMEQLYASELAA